MSQNYNDPAGGTASANGPQIRTDYFDRKALFETRQDRYFVQQASVKGMPKHYGKKIKKYHMMPLLDDRNVNDQGIDAAGTVQAGPNGGNLYGSSKDIGYIKGKLPLIGENGGRVNRVGFTRIELEGTMENYGMFHEFTEDLLNFDSMSDLYENISRELVSGAVQMTEAMLQIDIIEAAGVIRYAGAATSKATMTGEGTPSEVKYADLQNLDITLDNNRSPKQMQMLKGSTKFDTVTVGNGRLLFCGSELIPTLTSMVNAFGKEAFVSVEHYGYAGSYKEGTNMIHGEIGKVGAFRIIVHPQMLSEEGAGANVTSNEGYRETGGKYDIFPMVTVGADSFTTVGFQTGGGSDFKFKIITRMPGEIVTLEDPYAKTGFSSLQFWYGFMPLRKERIGVQWTVARL